MTTNEGQNASNTVGSFIRLDHTFVSQTKKCEAWLYLPNGISKPPVVIMAHGFGGERWMRLPAYAETFAARGMAVLVFDYRGFGGSEGQPRHYINPSRHIQDWEAAIAYARGLDVIDSKRVAMWGTSFSGGHVLVVAAKDPNISAVVSQVPFTDGMATAWGYDLLFQLQSIGHGLWDLALALLTGRRHNVRIAGRPGEKFAMMSRADTWSGLMNMLDIDEKTFEQDNFCPADIVFTLSFYRPVAYADKVACPALIIGAENDTLFPPDGPRKAANRMKKATYLGLPMKHFDPYIGEPFERLVVTMGDFLQSSLTHRSY